MLKLHLTLLFENIFNSIKKVGLLGSLWKNKRNITYFEEVSSDLCDIFDFALDLNIFFLNPTESLTPDYGSAVVEESAAI